MDEAVRTLVNAWDWSYVDFDMAFEGMSHETLHRRASESQISIAEVAAHTIYSEASIILRYLLDVPKEGWGDHFMLRDPYGWPPRILEVPSDPALLAMSVAEVKGAWRDHHQSFHRQLEPFQLSANHRFVDEWSEAAPDVETRLRFAAYHVAYHIGQIYTLRQVLGENTPDN
jgi:hypothetical protein